MQNDILGIHHVAISVSDLNRSIAFYKPFGFTVEQRLTLSGSEIERGTGVEGARLELAMLVRPHFRLELIQYLGSKHEAAPPPNTVGSAHVCFDVSNIETTYADLRANGVEFIGSPTLNEAGKNRWVYFLDPDGVIVELLERL